MNEHHFKSRNTKCVLSFILLIVISLNLSSCNMTSKNKGLLKIAEKTKQDNPQKESPAKEPLVWGKSKWGEVVWSSGK